MNLVRKRVTQQTLVSEAPGKVKRVSRVTQLLGVLLLLMSNLFLAGFSYQIGSARYQRDQILAKEGMLHLSNVREFLNAASRNPLDAHNIASMQREFSAALKPLTQVDNDLKSIPGAALSLPVYGPRLHAALHLVSLSLALSHAGMDGCDIMNLLISRLYNPLRHQTQGIMAADLVVIGQKLGDMQASFAITMNEIAQLQPSDMLFDPHLSKLVGTLRQDIPKLRGWLDGMAMVLPGALMLLGIDTPANYFIEVLDSTELRPGGGFIGNYGVATLSGGQLVGAHITDIDLLDRPFVASGLGIPFPPEYRWFDIARGNWGVRDSNLDADFPTAARAAESNYVNEGGDVKFQGVVAITPTFIQHTLAITGPIAVPEYNETITVQNLIERIHYYQLGGGDKGPDTIASPDGHSSLRKHFIALLAEHFLARVRQIAPTQTSTFLALLVDGMQTKDFQIYFDNPQAEKLLHSIHLDAAIQVPDGDDLLVVDANIGANKANAFIKNTLIDTVSIDNQGNATHHTTLHYVWTLPSQEYGLPLYRDYARVYVPKVSVLQAQDGWQPQGSSDAFGHKVWAGFFTLQYGGTRTITLDWRVPHAATYDKRGWHYQEMLQNQAGTIWRVHEQVQLPSCATLTNITGGIKSTSKQLIELKQSLTKNTSVAINYFCSP